MKVQVREVYQLSRIATTISTHLLRTIISTTLVTLMFQGVVVETVGLGL